MVESLGTKTLLTYPFKGTIVGQSSGKDNGKSSGNSVYIKGFSDVASYLREASDQTSRVWQVLKVGAMGLYEL